MSRPFPAEKISGHGHTLGLADILHDPSFRIISSLRWSESGSKEPEVDVLLHNTTDKKLLRFHLDRLRSAARALGWTVVVNSLEDDKSVEVFAGKIKDHIATPSNLAAGHFRIHKVRIAVSSQGDIQIDSAVIQQSTKRDEIQHDPFDTRCLTRPPQRLSSSLCQVHLDMQPTTPSVFTTHKTTYRTLYDDARSRGGISNTGPTQAEILLFNAEHEIMEASFSTPYFFRGTRWVTPPLSSGGNAGVTRRLALEDAAAVCEPAVVKVEDIRDGELIWLSNAVRGFFQGIMVLRE